MKRLNPAITSRKGKPASQPRAVTNLAGRVANAQAQKPLGTRAAAASQGHWIGPAYQSDHDLLWRFGDTN
jgi:hypothetical protein